MDGRQTAAAARSDPVWPRWPAPTPQGRWNGSDRRCRWGELAREYDGSGRISDTALRSDIIANEMLKGAFLLTQQRAVQESESGTPGAATSIFKYVEAEYVKQQLELQLQIRGTRGVGWSGDDFSEEELRMGRLWLEAKSISIAGGSNEIQLNILAKRVLGLPD